MYGLSKLLKNAGLHLYQWPVNKAVRILESSARGPYPVMLGDKFDYYSTEYDPAKIAHGKDPRAYADFQKLHYDDEMFDFVIASDVFEHVRDDKAGYREVFRVLKQGGSLVLTVPYDHEQLETVVRVDTSGEKDTHLLAPEYHGGGGHTLTYRNYGRDLLSLLHRIGFSVGRLDAEVPAYGIRRQSLFIARKGEYVELVDGLSEASRTKALGVLVPFRLFLLFKYTFKGFFHYWHEALRKLRQV
jgi:SAM-dependent methyltransferase